MRGWSGKLAVGLVLAVLALVGIAMESVIASMDLYLRKLPIQPPNDRQVAAVPRESESWVAVGPDRISSKEIVETLGTENYLSRTYVEKNPPEGQDRRAIELHMAYYTGMIDTVPHVPERCFVGGGMQPVRVRIMTPIPLSTGGLVVDESVPERLVGRVHTVRLPNRWSDRPGVRVRLPRDATTDLTMLVSEFANPSGESLWAGYFFIANGGLTASAEGVRTLAFDLEQDHAFYLKVQFSTASVDSSEELAVIAGSLLDDLFGEIMRCVPDWIEVEQGRYPPAPADDQSNPTTSDDPA